MDRQWTRMDANFRQAPGVGPDTKALRGAPAIPEVRGQKSEIRTEGKSAMNEKVRRIMGPVMDRRAPAVTLLQFGVLMLLAGLALGLALGVQL